MCVQVSAGTGDVGELNFSTIVPRATLPSHQKTTSKNRACKLLEGFFLMLPQYSFWLSDDINKHKEITISFQ